MAKKRLPFSREILLILSALSLYLSVGCGSSASHPPSPTMTANAAPFESSVAIDLSSSSSIDPNAVLTISNQGKQPLVMPAVFLQGDSALNRSSILRPRKGLKNEEFALSTWQFVSAHSQHYCNAGAPGDPDDYSSEPMRLFDGYGMGCCEQRAFILAWVWQGAGYQSRLVWMAFHEVPEIFYEGAWHMFDPDHGVYYLQLDNKTVASVADVIANPSLVARVKDANGLDPLGFSAQFMADQYAVQVPQYLTIDYSAEQTYLLQPGQSLNLNYAQIVPVFYGTVLQDFIPNAATGSFDWNLDYSKPGWPSLTSANTAVTTVNDGSSVFLTNSGPNTGFAIYAFSSPFPAISLKVNGLVKLNGPDAAVNAYFSTDGSSWSTAFPLTATAGVPTQASADLSSLSAGQYIYFVKLALSGNAPQSSSIANVHLVSQFQDSMFLFPHLVPGQVNHLTYQDWSPSTVDRQVNVSLSVQH
ncbi:MAG TPA: hypothetical protein VGK22_17650 [Candidatus Angelobacter sp.]